MADYTQLPREMGELPNWIGFRLIWDQEKDKFTKVPHSPHGNYKASTTTPKQWGSLAQALAAAKRYGYDGIGFVFTGSGFFGIDLDHCIENGVLADWARTIVDSFATYAEVSISGTGVHIYGQGVMPGDGRGKKHGGIEAYSRDRFFTVSGQALAGAVTTLEERQSELTAFVDRAFPKAEVKPKPASGAAPPLTDTSVVALLNKARAASNGDRFAALYDRGDLSGHQNDESRADLALCCHLAFWLGNDHGGVDSAFRSSALMRDKWDARRGESTYGEQTIARAVAATAKTYVPTAKTPTIKTSTVKCSPCTAPDAVSNVPTSEHLGATSAATSPLSAEDKAAESEEQGDYDLPGIVALARSITADLPVDIHPMSLTVSKTATEDEFAQIVSRLFQVKGAIDAPINFWKACLYEQMPKKYGTRRNIARKHFGPNWEGVLSDMSKAAVTVRRWAEGDLMQSLPAQGLGIPWNFFVEAGTLPKERRLELARQYADGERVTIKAIRAEKGATAPKPTCPKDWKSALVELKEKKGEAFVTMMLRLAQGDALDPVIGEFLGMSAAETPAQSEEQSQEKAGKGEECQNFPIVPTSEQFNRAGIEDHAAPPTPAFIQNHTEEQEPPAKHSAIPPCDYKEQNFSSETDDDRPPRAVCSASDLFPSHMLPTIQDCLRERSWGKAIFRLQRFCGDPPLLDPVYLEHVGNLRELYAARHGDPSSPASRW